MLKLGEIFLVSIEGVVVWSSLLPYRKNKTTNHWRSMEVASHCSASRERMLIIDLNNFCMTKVGRLIYIFSYAIIFICWSGATVAQFICNQLVQSSNLCSSSIPKVTNLGAMHGD